MQSDLRQMVVGLYLVERITLLRLQLIIFFVHTASSVYGNMDIHPFGEHIASVGWVKRHASLNFVQPMPTLCIECTNRSDHRQAYHALGLLANCFLYLSH